MPKKLSLWVIIIGIAAVIINFSKSRELSPGIEGTGEMFDRIASVYDIGNDILSLGMHTEWKSCFLNDLSLANNTNLLDLATGTGDIAILAKRLFNVSEVIGLDPSVEMIALARTKAKNAGFQEINFLHGDARSLPFPDDSFARITMSFGIRNIDNRTLALSEMKRVLKSGGFVGIMEFCPPESGVFGHIITFAVRYFLSPLASVFSSNVGEYEYLSRSILEFPTDFENVLRDSGLIVTKVRDFLGGLVKVYVGTRN